MTAAAVSAELSRITSRDKRILHLLDQHGVFTTEQLGALTFDASNTARNRLNLLWTRGVLDRFRHCQRPGSQSWRWVIGPLGAAIVAVGRGQALPRPSAVRDAAARLAASPRLPHRLAVNGFFVALTAYTRAHDGARLVRWWNEARCRETVGTLVRPDGHGIWAHAGHRVPFWLEMDLGTETVARVAGKLTGYANLTGTRHAYPVLFWFPSATREANLHAHCARDGVPTGLTIATASDDTSDVNGPAGAVWRVVGSGRSDRITLTDLPGGSP
ncbi:MAG: replication-relaxation family protein [Dactylosporangium sp.]|nr:replication-relaxation family protein [Dactylosporangium sp.]NNJ62408.1 replication-relaxation family protein [Dactylosporangium sp.]